VSIPFLDLSRRIASIRDELDVALASVLDESWFVLGPRVEAFERAFAAYCGAEHAVGVASGTDAITIALQSVGVGPGDEVVTTSNSGVPTVAAIEAAGAVPVLVDVDEATGTLDASRLDDVVSERTAALLPVHLYGQCADMGSIVAFARERRLKVVEDAAQAVGAEWEGRRAGTLGDAAAFSFYPTKNLGALGDGGAVVTNDPEAAQHARLLRNYGEESRYHSVLAGRNSRLDSVQAAALLVQLRHVDAWNARRREIAAHYAAELADARVDLPVEAPGRRHVYHLFVVRARRRDELRAALEAAGVGTLVHYPVAVHRQPAYTRLARPGLETGERLCEEVVSLPLYPELSDGEVETVASAVRSWSRP
jgi:dTDP-4-amino-4,6-dideoxygalactose transaminase